MALLGPAVGPLPSRPPSVLRTQGPVRGSPPAAVLTRSPRLAMLTRPLRRGTASLGGGGDRGLLRSGAIQGGPRGAGLTPSAPALTAVGCASGPLAHGATRWRPRPLLCSYHGAGRDAGGSGQPPLALHAQPGRKQMPLLGLCCLTLGHTVSLSRRVAMTTREGRGCVPKRAGAWASCWAGPLDTSELIPGSGGWGGRSWAATRPQVWMAASSRLALGPARHRPGPCPSPL